MNSNADIRWKQRFQNFSRAFALLREAMELDPAGLSQLEIDDSDLPYPVDLLHYDTLKNARLKDHIDRIGIVIYDRQQTHCGK